MSRVQTSLVALLLAVGVVAFVVPFATAFGARVSLLDLMLGAFGGGAWSVARIVLVATFVSILSGLFWCVGRLLRVGYRPRGHV